MNSNVWSSIKKRLRVSINPALMRVWVEPLSASYENGIVYIVAPNEFVLNWVRDHLLGRIQAAAKEVLGTEVGVVINLHEDHESSNPREFMTDVTAYYAADEILASINRLTEIVRNSDYTILRELAEESGEEDAVHEAELEPQTFDSILDAVLEAFALSFRELMLQENEHSMQARRALYYLCFRYGIPAEEVALNMDCTVSEVRMGADMLENEISSAIDNGEDLDELLIRIFKG